MKRSILFILVSVTLAFAQSPTAFRTLDRNQLGTFGSPTEYNSWAGAKLSYPLVGSKGDFNTHFGLDGKFTIDFIEFDLGRTWYLLTYGNLSIPQPRKQVYNVVASQDDGLVFGLQGYTIFGKAYQKALTAIAGASTKITGFGSTNIYSYRFESALEVSLGGKRNLPLVLNLNPAYVLIKNNRAFNSIQIESTNKGFWTVGTSLILPVGDKLGLLVQGNFVEHVKPTVAVGIILSAGL